MSKNLDKTVRLQSEKTEEWIQEISGEYHMVLQKAGVAHPSWPNDQPHRFSEETSVRDPLQPDSKGGEKDSFSQLCQRIGGKLE